MKHFNFVLPSFLLRDGVHKFGLVSMYFTVILIMPLTKRFNKNLSQKKKKNNFFLKI